MVPGSGQLSLRAAAFRRLRRALFERSRGWQVSQRELDEPQFARIRENSHEVGLYNYGKLAVF